MFKGYRMKKTYYKYKGYAHFDKKISIQHGRKLAENPDYVAKHSFYPFLHFTLKINRYKRKKKTPVERRAPKTREIFYAAHIDRYIFQHYAHMLNEKYNLYCLNHGLDELVVAYRTNKIGKCNIDFAYEAFSFLKEHPGSIVITGDFESFFDNLDHVYLKRCLQAVLGTERLSDDWFAVYKNICYYSYVDIKKILDFNKCTKDLALPRTLRQLNHCDLAFSIKDLRERHFDWMLPLKEDRKNYGIPQGSPISGVFANVYMIEFDEKIYELCQKVGGFYRRYSDDFIVIFPNTLQQDVGSQVKSIFDIKDYVSTNGRLELQPEKTKCYYYGEDSLNEIPLDGSSVLCQNQHIDFLGFSFDGKNIDIRKKTVDRNINKIMHKARRIKKMRGFVRRDGTVVRVSFKPLLRYSSKNYISDTDKNGRERRKSTFNAYLKRSLKIFKGEPLLKSRYLNRRRHAVRLINRVIQKKKAIEKN